MFPVAAALLALMPAALWLLLFWSRDRDDPEPIGLILGLVAAGALVAVPAALVVNTGLGLVIGPVVTLLAGFTEEPIKTAVARWRARASRAFDEPLDGMIFGTSVALGFAAAETTLYLVGFVIPLAESAAEAGLTQDAYALGVLAPLRGLFSALGHALWTGIAGYFLAQHLLAGAGIWRLAAGVALAATLHSAYNTFAEVAAAPLLLVAAAVYIVLFRRAAARSPRRARRLAAVPAAGASRDARFCTHCGAPRSVAARHCGQCGRAL